MKIKRYCKIIFNKKSIILFTTSAIIFNIYTLILNKTYEKFYINVQKEIELEAVIISSKTENTYYSSYIVKGKNGIFTNKKFILYTSKSSNINYGDKIKIFGEFTKPSAEKNYKGFNYKEYLQTNKIYGSIKSNNVKLISENNTNLLLKLNNKIRANIIKQIQKILPDTTGGLLIRLLLGDKSYMKEDVVNYFQKSSLAHILAVSGTHVAYIIIGLTYIITINKVPKKSGYLFIIFSLIVVTFITNFSISVIRATAMSIILIISKIIYRKADIKNTLAISLLILLIINPYSIMNLSLQLSYLGTIGIIFLAPFINKIIYKLIKIKFKYKEGLSKALSIPIAAQITILPIIIINFNTISLTFLISNLIATPLLAISIICGFLTIFVSFIWINFAKKVGIILNIILEFLIAISKIFSKLKISNIYIVTPSLLTIIIYYTCVVIIAFLAHLKFSENLKNRQKKYLNKLKIINCKKVILILVMFILAIEIPYKNYNGKLKINFIDVGQRR